MSIITETHTVNQRPLKLRRSLRDILHRQSRHKEDALNPPLPHLPFQDIDDTKEYVFDVLFECQRGSLSVGYSSKTLLQFDPNPWCDRNMRFTPMNIEDFQLPDPSWQWTSKSWMVDMSGDVDEAGWQYAVKFHGAMWHGNYKHFRSFVRRRRWIRLRCRSKSDNNNKQIPRRPTKLIDADDTLTNTYNREVYLERLKRCRLDRERMRILNAVIQSIPPEEENQLLTDAYIYISYFDYEQSKLIFLQKIFQHTSEMNDHELKAAQSLQFYNDCEMLHNKGSK